MPTTWVERSFETPTIALQCDCGWKGADVDVSEWSVDSDRDRVVRRCPGCGRPVPEWGTLRSLEGAALIARGSLKTALNNANIDTPNYPE